MSATPPPRHERIRRRLEGGGNLTQRERREIHATGRMIDAAAADLQMLAEDDAFMGALPGLAARLERDFVRELRLIAMVVQHQAELSARDRRRQ